MPLSLESTPPASPAQPRNVHELGAIAPDSRSRSASRTLNVSPYTTFYTSSPPPQLQRHAAMSLLFKTAEGRERTLRFVQYMLRLYCWTRTRSRQAATGARKATRLLLLVFALSAFRKLRSLSEIIAPFVPAGVATDRLRAIAGSPAFTNPTTAYSDSSTSFRVALEGNVGSTRWLWAKKYAWAGSDPKYDQGYQAAMPPISDEQSLLLRKRLEGLEVTLALLDTVTDGIALFARFGITLSLPFEALRKRLGLYRSVARTASSKPHTLLQELFVRAESLADVFWLLSTLVAVSHSEWERREVWKYGKRVRRLMREEEVERDKLDRQYDLLSYSGEGLQETYKDITGNGSGMQSDGHAQTLEGVLQESEVKGRRIRSQRRVLRDLRGRLIWLWWDRLRLGADGVFALCDLLEWRLGGETIRVAAGGLSAAIGFAQIWSETTRHTKSGHKTPR